MNSGSIRAAFSVPRDFVVVAAQPDKKMKENKMKKENRGETKSLKVTDGKLFPLLWSREGGEGDEFLNSPLPPLFTREGKKDK